MHNLERKINMALYILQFFFDYLCYFIGGIIQILFILLPVSLKNWSEDYLNCMTYISFQLVIAGILFIIAPWVLEATLVSTWTYILLIGFVALIAIFRVIKAIPFELTHPITLKILFLEKLDFSEFYNSTRFTFLSSSEYLEGDGKIRYNALRESLIRLKKDKSKSYMDED